MASFVSDLFGGCDLLNGNERISSVDALKGKDVIGLYFSASWCGPCKRFTPMLKDVYDVLKSEGRGFEIVFVSSDSDDDSFLDYYGKMPWLAVPYDEDVREGELPYRFGCNGIPYLVLLDDRTGKEITREGVEILSQFGPAAFPYTEEAINHALEASRQRLLAVVNNWDILGSEVNASEFRTKEAVAVLIGSSSGPASKVAPRLQAAYESLGPSRLSVVYIPHGVTNGHEETKFQASMPAEWIKMQRPDNVLGALVSVFGGPPRPCLAVFSGDGKVLFNEDASMMVFQLKACGFPWRPSFVEDFKKDSFNCPGLKFLNDARLVKRAADGGVTVVGGSEILMNNDLVGLYFSAHWCGPCRSFTPMFSGVYNQLKASGKRVEVVFVSSDRDEKSFEDYYTTDMPWLALDFAQRELKELISMSLDVQGIPTLIWVNPRTGEMLMNGRETVMLGAEYFPWTPDLVQSARSGGKEGGPSRGVEC